MNPQNREIVDKIKEGILGGGDLREEMSIWLNELGEDWELIEQAIKELRAELEISGVLTDTQKRRIRESNDTLAEAQYEEWGGKRG